MAEPWLSIIGLGEDGPAGLSDASRAALAAAKTIFGAPRHLGLVEAGARGREWPVPFDLGPLLAMRGQSVAMVVSGEPFWFGAGGTVAAHLAPEEWRSYSAPGIFSLIASRLGLRLEEVLCLGLHAAPFTRLRPVLARGVRAICTLRDGVAVADLARWLGENGFGATRITVCEAVGGPRERIRQGADWTDIETPVAVVLDGKELPRDAGMSRSSGLADELFTSDGQITKRPVRALTLSALAPRPGALLWDIGGGSGSVSIEWCLAGGRAIAIEARGERAANIRLNAANFGVAHLMTVIEGRAPHAFAELAAPDAVFVGGGGDDALYATLWPRLPEGARLVANGVTIETEAVLAACHAAHGGSLLRVELSEAAPLGSFRGWQASRPLVQWSVMK